MKAITCSQCGALITKFSKNDNFADCEYCNAKIRIREKKIKEVSNNNEIIKKVSFNSYQRYLKRRQEIEEKSRLNQGFYNKPKVEPGTILIIISIILIFSAPIALYTYFSSIKNSKSNKTIEKAKNVPPTSTPIKFEIDTNPTQIEINRKNFNYKVNVTYRGSIVADHIEIPQITQELPTYDVNELKKTVFKTRRIRIRASIDKEGNVTKAKALNGHDILKESALDAAKKSLFAKRNRPTKLTLTYVFILLK